MNPTVRTLLLAATLTALCGPPTHAQFERGMVVTGFRVPEYDEDGRLKTQVFGDRAEAVSETVVDITHLRIETFRDDEVDMRIQASHCRFDQKTGIATSDSEVRITRSHVVISGAGFQWQTTPHRLEIYRDARVVIRRNQSRKRNVEERIP